MNCRILTSSKAPLMCTWSRVLKKLIFSQLTKKFSVPNSTSCSLICHSNIWCFIVKQSVRYEGVSKSFRTGGLERELQMVQLSATRCSCIAILWVSLVSFATITLRVASQWVFIVVSVYFAIDSVRELLDTPSYTPRDIVKISVFI
jgi:hypothetical protein